jgi:hypothetical protein
MSKDDLLSTIQKKNTAQLLQDAAGYKPESHPGLAHRYEIERRKNAVSRVQNWIAITISILSLAVSLYALLK